MIPEVVTERLRLRAFRDDDLDAWAAIVADEETGRFIGGARGREDAWRSIAMYLGHWELRGFGQWAVERSEDGVLVGRCGLWFPEGWPEVEVGWTFARVAWGRGYATEAGRASMAWAAAERGMTRICSVIDHGNARSIRVAERLGMAAERDVVVSGTPALLYARSLPL